MYCVVSCACVSGFGVCGFPLVLGFVDCGLCCLCVASVVVVVWLRSFVCHYLGFVFGFICGLRLRCRLLL